MDSKKVVIVKTRTGIGYEQLRLWPTNKGNICLTRRTSGGKSLAMITLTPSEALALQAAINDCLLQMGNKNE